MKKLLMIAAMVAVVGIAGTAEAVLLDLSAAPWAVSSTGWSLGGNLAFDNVGGTRWSSNPGSLPAWIRVDLGQDYELNTVWVDFQQSAGTFYTVRVLPAALAGSENNPAAYTTIGTASGLHTIATQNPSARDPEGARDTWDFSAGTVAIPGNLPPGTGTVNVLDPIGRYLMVYSTGSWDTGFNNISIWEIDIDGDDPPPPPIPEPAGLGLVGVALLAMRRRRS